ncbi:MAG: ribosome silencing factor, partial [Candidatus Omnitrophota bacterium]|nr:ribosome silencing factor [Candidatus Omnitrophota bacterium]
IASGASTTQVRAIAEHIVKTLRLKGQRLWHIEGEKEALWVLLDYGDCVVHVFLDEIRHFYDLERLWSDAPQTRFKERPYKRVSQRRLPIVKLSKKTKRKR